MSAHRCAGDGCGYCDALIARAEQIRAEAPLAGDQEQATRRAEQAFEAQLFGEPATRPAPAGGSYRLDDDRALARRAARHLIGGAR